MTNESEKKEYTHWQDLAQQLGADPSEEIYDYFSGTAQFEDDLGDAEVGDGQRNDDSNVVTADDSTNDEVLATGTDLSDETPSIDVETRSEHPPNESFEPTPEPSSGAMGQGNELEIDWSTPVPTKPAPKAKKAAKPKPKRRPQKKEPDQAPPAATGHWDDLANSLGIDAPVVEPTEPPENGVEEPVVADSNLDEIQTIGWSDDLSGEGNQPDDARNDEASPAELQPGQSAKLFDEDETDEDQEKPAAILDQMFVPPEEPFQDEEIEQSSSGYEDSFDKHTFEHDVAAEPFSAESEYIEFEIEELDPAGASDSERLGVDAPDEDPPRRKPRRRRSGSGSDQSRGRRRSSREDDTEDVESREAPKKTSSRRDDTRRGERVRRSRATAKDQSDSDASSDNDTRKKKKFPTWEETVNIIVDSNLVSRKKSRRRGRGRGRGNRSG